MPVAITDQDSWSSGHSLGVQMWRKYDRVYLGHTGSMPGYLAVLMIHRSSRTAVVAFANTYSLGGISISGLGIELLTAVLENEPVSTRPWRPTATEPPAEIAPLLGPWWWMGEQFDVSWNGELVVNEAGHPASAWRFALDAAGVWRCHSGMNDGETLRVNRDAAGTPKRAAPSPGRCGTRPGSGRWRLSHDMDASGGGSLALAPRLVPGR